MALDFVIMRTEEGTMKNKLLGTELVDQESSIPLNLDATSNNQNGRRNYPRKRMKRLDEILDTREVQAIIQKEIIKFVVNKYSRLRTC